MLSLLKGTQLNVVQRQFVDTCHRSAECLLNVLNDILVFSRAESDNIVLERIPFQLMHIIEDVTHVSASTAVTAAR